MVHQVALRILETIRAKLTFDREDQKYGIAVKTYHTDNGILISDGLIQELLTSYHKIYFSGTGDPNQNVVS